MATCKDCLHKCYTEELAEAEQTCNFFIDKSKYELVTRCRDCVFGQGAGAFRYCRRLKETFPEDGFCSFADPWEEK